MVLEDGALARRIGLRGQRFFTASLGHWYNGGPKPEIEDLPAGEHEALMNQEQAQMVAWLNEEKIAVGSEHTGLFNPNHAYGTARDAIAYMERLFAAGADEIMMLMQMGTVPHEAIMQSIRNIGQQVIPHFRNHLRSPSTPQKIATVS